jgi:hypothetical protein
VEKGQRREGPFANTFNVYPLQQQRSIVTIQRFGVFEATKVWVIACSRVAAGDQNISTIYLLGR